MAKIDASYFAVGCYLYLENFVPGFTNRPVTIPIVSCKY